MIMCLCFLNTLVKSMDLYSNAYRNAGCKLSIKLFVTGTLYLHELFTHVYRLNFVMICFTLILFYIKYKNVSFGGFETISLGSLKWYLAPLHCYIHLSVNLSSFATYRAFQTKLGTSIPLKRMTGLTISCQHHGMFFI